MSERAVHFATIRHGGATAAAVVDDQDAHVLAEEDLGQFLAAGLPQDWASRVRAKVPLDQVDWAPLVPRPEKIICLGHNYLSHIVEMGREVPTWPVLFGKFARALIGARDPICLPAVSDRMDWEAELAMVVGRTARHATKESAQESIAGFTVINDVSARDYQRRTSQWLQGKTFEGCTPLGPVLVPGHEIDWAEDLVVRCFVDGEKVQEMRTSDMLFKPVDVIVYISKIITLVPGDVIALGTGAGVGDGRTPARYLAPGQLLETTIDGIGMLSNECVEAS